MRINKLLMLSCIFILGLSMFSFGQKNVNQPQVKAKKSKVKAIKNLRKGLEKYSRYQYQDLTIFFDPVNFKTCEVTYQFSIGGASINNSSPLDSYQRTRDETGKLEEYITSDGNGKQQTETRVKPGRRNSEMNKINELEKSRKSVRTSVNLANLNVDSIKINKLSTGIFIAVEIKKIGNSSDVKKEVFPIINMEKAKKLKALFIEAGRQCK